MAHFFVVSPLPQPPDAVRAKGKGKWKSHKEVRGHKKTHQGKMVRRGVSESSQVRTTTSECASVFLRGNRYKIQSIKLQPVWHRSHSRVKKTTVFLPIWADPLFKYGWVRCPTYKAPNPLQAGFQLALLLAQRYPQLIV
jgi:hypothetical protein